MFVIRQAAVEDTSTLLKLAKMVHFINLPADPDIINSKIVRSRGSFAGSVQQARDRQFMFVLEDTETGNVVGTSSIMSSVSWPGHPHVFLIVRRRQMYSEDLQAGQVHVTLQLGADESGPSEIGGLILGPSYRGHKERLGALLSLVRFHYVGLHRDWFADRVIAEMMGALTPDSRNLLWEYLGRRFINLDYAEADRFSQGSKEFITSLFPKEELYASLLPAVARKLIGHVGPETEPAKAMLGRLGFSYNGHIDPFDGGPYLEAELAGIPLVTATRVTTLTEPQPLPDQPERAFVSFEGRHGFRAVRTPFHRVEDGITIPGEFMELIEARPGSTVGVTPLPARREAEPRPPEPESAAT
ncbi:MAG: arginine N-succinyltransferase [Planctomycetota bacterium]|jgi:arginine N-succinyltransferase